MKLLNHIKYFYYIASNWSYKLGWFTLKKEIQGERRYNIDTTAAISLSKLKLKGSQLKHATEYMPVNYFTLEALLDRMPDTAKKGAFLDIGCGKGRALCVAAAYGYKKVEGIDFAKELIEAANTNLEKLKKQYPTTAYNLAWGDLNSLTIDEHVTTIFLFNPFDEVLMKHVIRKINSSLAKRPRRLFVLYCTPRHEELFFEDGFDVTFRVKKFGYLEGVILEKSNSQ
ncbi:class I SAM-dependent methyltransferase [Lacibacter luteus]|uniref:Class I SAM-dependent methyltransferase n=1 Tax=Lacibacter luteus TaxID=2508719 RepID=A0A4Q1CQ05_9BACT|nr:class I SAM-dependent methyltransferase [Lacibacter luteus]RXK62821.1 class I SAM-dependent methyltransferase [Lacibacter luteus]